MTWKKYWQIHTGKKNQGGGSKNVGKGEPAGNVARRYAFPPEIYEGNPQRLERYKVYDMMDQDSEVRASLDIIADFATTVDDKSKLNFDIEYEEATEAEIEIIKNCFKQWIRLNKFHRNIWEIFRHTIKYGDQFFIRDPETLEWRWVDPSKVESILVDENKGKEPVFYLIRDLDLNLQASTATNAETFNTLMSTNINFISNRSWSRSGTQGGGSGGGQGSWGKNNSTEKENKLWAVQASHVIHVSLSQGMDANWPFGNSILEGIYKTYKQKELLEESVLIYRVTRAPERRIFHIDVGDMPTFKATSYLEKVKNEIHQRRIPNRTGGGTSIVDAGYSPLCISLDTLLPLVDGRELTLQKCIDEYNKGKKNWVYSCNPITGEIIPSPISWAGITKMNVEVIKITLDNGESFICTPDHKIPLLGKGFVEAKDIKINEDSLISFQTRKEQIHHSKKHSDYLQVYDHKKNEWKFVHRLVAKTCNIDSFVYDEKYKDSEKKTIHHKDYDRFNNNPDNLVYMNRSDHVLFHSKNKVDFWNKIPLDEGNKLRARISNTVKENWKNLDKEARNEKINQLRLAQKKAIDLYKNDPEHRKYRSERASILRKKQLQDDPTLLDRITSHLTTHNENCPNQTFVSSRKMLELIINTVKTKSKNQKEVIKLLNENKEMIDEIISLNPKQPKMNHKITYAFEMGKLKKILAHFEYKGWKDFVAKIENYNHKVVSIEYLDTKMDVGTLTIDAEELYSSYHTFALSCGIFVKNSMMDDYFFAKTSDGRGSEVTTLAGGENLGEINDLRYFLNKLIRGLQIPSSYLPTGPDDGTTAYSDGKAGTAYIQEFRFSRYCERLQNLICHYFDHEFKYFLKQKGLMIDTSIFEVKFNAPQNFSQFAQIERDSAQIDVFGKVSEIKYISKRFALKRWLRLTEDEIKENEELWIEENSKKVKATTDQDPGMSGGGGGLSDVGIKGSELNSFDDEFGDLGGEEGGAEGEGSEGGAGGLGAPDAGGAPELAGGGGGMGGGPAPGGM